MAGPVNHDAYAGRVQTALEREYLPEHPGATFRAYRYNSASIRVRVIDPDFRGKSIAARERDVWRALDKLPEPIRADISMLLLLTPEESQSSLLSAEFDEPVRSQL